MQETGYYVQPKFASRGPQVSFATAMSSRVSKLDSSGMVVMSVTVMMMSPWPGSDGLVGVSCHTIWYLTVAGGVRVVRGSGRVWEDILRCCGNRQKARSDLSGRRLCRRGCLDQTKGYTCCGFAKCCLIDVSREEGNRARRR